jgi:hypothetical protein
VKPPPHSQRGGSGCFPTGRQALCVPGVFVGYAPPDPGREAEVVATGDPLEPPFPPCIREGRIEVGRRYASARVTS